MTTLLFPMTMITSPLQTAPRPHCCFPWLWSHHPCKQHRDPIAVFRGYNHIILANNTVTPLLFPIVMITLSLQTAPWPHCFSHGYDHIILANSTVTPLLFPMVMITSFFANSIVTPLLFPMVMITSSLQKAPWPHCCFPWLWSHHPCKQHRDPIAVSHGYDYIIPCDYI
jgi:hypothetical protein